MDLDAVLEEVAAAARPHAEEGEVATYIPSIAEMDPGMFGLALVELDGTEHVVGDVDVPFPIQSISKVFSLVLAMRLTDDAEDLREGLWQRVGVEPSGDPFNSLVQLEHERGIPRNPMINAGALVVDDILLDLCDDPATTLLNMLGELAAEEIGIDETVMEQEGRSGHRNRSITYLMSSFENVHHPIEDIVDVYVGQCAVMMTARQLARACRFLANNGVDPTSGKQILTPARARRVTAIMLTCGTYDAAGEFAFDVGIPCKSGVAGGIMGVVPDRMGVCAWSPPLDRNGNSTAGRTALHELSERTDLSLF
jgi:glutaminase